MKKIKTAAETSVEDGWRIPLGGVPADFSHRDSRTVGRITRIAGGVGGWRRGPNEISRYVNAGRRVRGLSLSLSLSMRPRNQIRERDLPWFRVVGCVQRLRAVTGAQLPRPVSLSLSVSPPCDARLPFYCHLPLRLRRGYPTRFVLCNEGQGEEDRR